MQNNSDNLEKKYSLTKIVATLGPACDDENVLREMIKAGVNVARINCSHGDWNSRRQRIELIRNFSKEFKRAIGIMADLQGPKIRTGTLPEAGVEIKRGEQIILTTDEAAADYNSSIKKVFIRNYPQLPDEVAPGQKVLLDDGLLRMRVLEVKAPEVKCEVRVGGILKSNKGVNLPESAQLKVEAITKKDREDLVEAVKAGVDFIALSFVRRAEDIIELKRLIKEACPVTPIKVIAKIEKPQAMDHLQEILKEVDGVMVARGDLGVELDPEKVPILQKEIIRQANLNEKFVITATQMMDSMIKNPFPTRAEVSDVANAILDGTDAVMLSGETAAGAYPVLAVDYMRKVALEVESSGLMNLEKFTVSYLENQEEEKVNALGIAESVKNLVKTTKVKKIVAFSCSGRSAQLISKLRPKAKILAATTYKHTYNYLSLIWGVEPIFFDRIHSTTQTIINIEEDLVAEGVIDSGETVIITGGLPIAARSSVNFVKIHKCDGSLKELMKIQEEQFKAALGPTLVH